MAVTRHTKPQRFRLTWRRWRSGALGLPLLGPQRVHSVLPLQVQLPRLLFVLLACCGCKRTDISSPHPNTSCFSPSSLYSLIKRKSGTRFNIFLIPSFFTHLSCRFPALVSCHRALRRPRTPLPLDLRPSSGCWPPAALSPSSFPSLYPRSEGENESQPQSFTASSENNLPPGSEKSHAPRR